MLSKYQEQYKRLGFGRENIQVNRTLRRQQRSDEWRKSRFESFSVIREQCDDRLVEAMNNEETPNTSKQPDEAPKTDASEETAKLLEKRRDEKNRRKPPEKKVKKPPFIVGVVRHRIWSPPFTKKPFPPLAGRICKLKENHPSDPAVTKPSVPKPLTKATQNRLKNKAMHERKTKKTNEVKKVSLAPKNHTFKPPAGIDAIPLFGRRAMEEAKQSDLLDVHSVCYTQPIGDRFIASFSSDVESLTPMNTSTPVPPSAASLLPLGNPGAERKELRRSISISSLCETDISKNLFQEFFRDSRDCPKNDLQDDGSSSEASSRDETTVTIAPENTSSVIETSDDTLTPFTP